MNKRSDWTIEKRDLMLPDESRDSKQIVDKTIAGFAVFTRATLTSSSGTLAQGQAAPEGLTRFVLREAAIVAAVVSLLLRYIVGSAVHFYAAYVPKTELARAHPACASRRSRSLHRSGPKGSYSTSSHGCYSTLPRSWFSVSAVGSRPRRACRSCCGRVVVGSRRIYLVRVRGFRRKGRGRVAKRWRRSMACKRAYWRALMSSVRRKL